MGNFGGAQSAKKKNASPPPKKKGGKGAVDDDDLPKKPKEKTRNDYRILSELRRPFKADNYEHRLS